MEFNPTLIFIRRLRQFAFIFALAVGPGIVCAAPANALNGCVVYTYDALGRIITATYDSGVIVIYTYDANGNRTQQQVVSNSPTTLTQTLIWGSLPTTCTGSGFSDTWGQASPPNPPTSVW